MSRSDFRLHEPKNSCRSRQYFGGTASKRSTLYGWIKKGLFPPPIRIGPRRVAWRETEVDAWIAARPVASR